MARALGFRRIQLRAGTIAGIAAALLAASWMVAVGAANSAAVAAAGCRVTYTAPSQWQGGFTANVDITNLGDAVNGWNLVWTFPSGQRVTQAWNATTAQSGSQVTATNMSYNASIPTNGTVSFGFNGSWSGSNTAPTSFTLNGTVCNGGVGGPGSPSPSRSQSGSPSPSQSQPPQPGNAMATVAAMQPGWNLGNSFDAVGADETAWGNPRVTQALLDTIRAQGFNSIRIPVTWSNHHGPAPSYTIDSAWLNRIREVIGWALADGFYVMVNIHHDSWQWINTLSTDHTNVRARYDALWTQLAAAFRNESSKLVLESVNEPQFTGVSGDAQSYDLLNELNTSFVRIVRASGGANATRLLVLPTLFTNADQGRLDALRTNIAQLNDRNLAATIHFYGFWPFSANVAGYTRFDSTVEQDLIGTFDRAYNTFVAGGIPVILGEYGLLSFDYTRPGILERGEVLKFFESFGNQARLRNITTMIWDAGSFLNRPELQWRDPALFALIKTTWTMRSPTASTDQLYVPRTGTVTSRSLTLNLNGATFQGLRQGGTDLVNGTDYTVSGSTLTLTASAMTRLVGNRAYGLNATIEARFNRGVPWRIEILTFDPPVLTNATGSTGSFRIPTQFRGDQLATMEAKYADGSNAGPQNWTSFKEFWVAFRPDYTGNALILPPELFNEVNDNSRVTLTFHFWSGTQITYFVTESGGSVTGTTG